MNRQIGSSVSNWLVVSILVAHVFLGVVYSVITPLWESFDEWGHYPYVEYIARERALPRERLTEANDETHQPPLYYVLGALATFWVDTEDRVELVENEYSVHRGGEGGLRFYLHSADQQFPYRGTALAAHVTRLVSVLLGTVPVLATYLTAGTLFPERKDLALGAMAVSAFWPQLLFMGSVINNDIAVTAFASLVLLFLMRMLVRSPRPLDILGLGISLCAALLSKRNGLALLPFTFVALAVIAIERSQDEGMSWTHLGWACLFLVGLIFISSWWFKDLRDVYLSHLMRVFSVFSQPKGLSQLYWGRLPSGLYFCLATFFASFGRLPLGVEPWIYQLVAVLCLTALAGLFISFLKGYSGRLTRIGVVILMVHGLAILAAPAYRALSQGGPSASPTVVGSIQSTDPLLFSKNVFLFQGRFVLPAISSFSVLFILGLVSLVPRRLQTGFLGGVSLVLVAFSVLVPFRYIRPAYAAPSRLSRSEVEEIDHRLGVAFGEKIELVGYEVGVSDVQAGSVVPLTLYWRCLEEMDRNYGLRIQILGTNARVYGDLSLHPGHGSLPTSLWKQGDVFGETYQVPLAEDIPTPSLAHIRVSFLADGSSPDPLDALDDDGNPTEAAFGRLVVRARQELQVEHPIYYELGGKAALIGYGIDFTAERQLTVTLFWQALAEMEEDYTVLFHLVDEDGELVTQRDGQPNGGLTPTSIWKAGEVIRDEYVISLPTAPQEGHYSVRIGLYDLRTMERLPVFDSAGSRLPHDVIVLDEISPASDIGQGPAGTWSSIRLLANVGYLEDGLFPGSLARRSQSTDLSQLKNPGRFPDRTDR